MKVQTEGLNGFACIPHPMYSKKSATELIHLVESDSELISKIKSLLGNVDGCPQDAPLDPGMSKPRFTTTRP